MCIPYVILKVEELQMFDIFKIFDQCDVNHRETFTDKSNNGSFDFPFVRLFGVRYIFVIILIQCRSKLISL
jgi:hypothetical protein